MTAPSDGPVATPRAPGASRAAGASALWRDLAGGAAADPGFAWALGLGVVLIVLGVLGFVPNPLVGAPSAAWGTPLLLTGDAHDVIHLVGGAVALHAALGLSRARRAIVLIALGAAALVLLALGLLDGRWFGIAPWPVGLADQLLHLIVGLGSLVMGLAGSGTIVVPVVTGAYRRAGAAASAAEPVSAAESVAAAEPASAAEPVAAAEPSGDLAPSGDTPVETAPASPIEPAGDSPPSGDAPVETGPDVTVRAEATLEPPGLGVDDDQATSERPDSPDGSADLAAVADERRSDGESSADDHPAAADAHGDQTPASRSDGSLSDT